MPEDFQVGQRVRFHDPDEHENYLEGYLIPESEVPDYMRCDPGTPSFDGTTHTDESYRTLFGLRVINVDPSTLDPIGITRGELKDLQLAPESIIIDPGQYVAFIGADGAVLNLGNGHVYGGGEGVFQVVRFERTFRGDYVTLEGGTVLPVREHGPAWSWTLRGFNTREEASRELVRLLREKVEHIREGRGIYHVQPEPRRADEYERRADEIEGYLAT